MPERRPAALLLFTLASILGLGARVAWCALQPSPPRVLRIWRSHDRGGRQSRRRRTGPRAGRPGGR